MTQTPKTSCLYPYKWELAVHANLRRYPTNPRVPLLRSSEILRDDITITRQEAETNGISTINAITFNNNKNTRVRAFPSPQSSIPPDCSPPTGRSDASNTIIIPTSELMDPTSANAVPRIGVRTIIRRCQIDTELPNWLKKAVKLEYMTFIHTTRIDSRMREMTIQTANETFSNTVRLGDYTCYREPRPSDNLSTIPVIPYPTEQAHQSNQSSQNFCYFEQYAFLELRRIPLAANIEKYALRNYTKNTSEGRRLDMLFMQDAIDAGFAIPS